MSDALWDEAVGRIITRLDATIADDRPGFPHFADPHTGEWTRSPDGDWTGGFWVGQLWLAAAVLGEERYLEHARRWCRQLEPRATSDTVFRGFLFWYGAALGWLLAGDEQARSVGLAGASGLARSFNEAARLLPLGPGAEEASHVSWSDTNIDGVGGGTPLLAWAAVELAQPDLRAIALAHAERHIELCVRADASVCQSASFDPRTGMVERRYTHKGITDESTWARAQAWAMLGFSQACALDRDRFEATAARVADWWVEHLPSDRVARWDFDDPAGAAAPTDTSATAIAAASLLKLSDLGVGRSSRYRTVAVEMMGALVERHLSPSGILGDGCYNNRIGLATRSELIWGDYFLLESLCVLTGRLRPVSV